MTTCNLLASLEDATKQQILVTLFGPEAHLQYASYPVLHNHTNPNKPQILNSLHLIDQDALRRYLLTKTQHQIGGFGKLPGDPPGELFLYISESVVVMRQFGALM